MIIKKKIVLNRTGEILPSPYAPRNVLSGIARFNSLHGLSDSELTWMDIQVSSPLSWF